MAQTSNRQPAWKRLGLKLQNGDQSTQEHAPQNHQHQHDEVSRERGGAVQSPSHVSLDPIDLKKSQLGKRKHEHEPAEKNKKSKTSKHQSVEQDTIQKSPPATGHANNPVNPEPVSNARPKGDANYRKKKNQRNGRNATTEAHSDSRSLKPKVKDSALKRPRTPSLSPDPGLLASTETDFHQGQLPQNSSSSPPPPRPDRRKSVTFTPDTKTVDGNSASNLFKKWVQDQKATEEFTEAEVAQFAPPPKVHPANGIPPTETKDTKKAKKAKKSTAQSTPTISEAKGVTTEPKAPAAANKKKDPSRYLDYLTAYHTDRSNWKFNKAIQNDVLSNALNIFRIPEEHSEALIAYVQGLQGAGVIQRLKQQCATAIEEIEAAGTDSDMDDPKDRKAAQEQALKEQLTKQRKRRRLDRDIDNALGHPYSEGYIRRLKKGRAQALLKALNIAAPAPAPALAPSPRTNGEMNQKPTRKRKQRLEDISSDESTDSSSSEESSESESDSDSDSDSDSATDSSDNDSGGSSDSSSSADDKESDSSDSDS
ncbi:hypothetical protein DM02DRAFT_617568 [Periconia macrospinosa]|uniref:WKF domain-containing protein n=1 Tax=Periconia macrospinosa TaxID=97972 RepID=A0A2V1DCM5_9PLEO|nr:hypothetical protein DM02DRAFT_617568 [Periconia macrospinosa]